MAYKNMVNTVEFFSSLQFSKLHFMMEGNIINLSDMLLKHVKRKYLKQLHNEQGEESYQHTTNCSLSKPTENMDDSKP